MSGAGQTPKAPARPRKDGDVTIYYDTDTEQRMELEVTPQPDGNIDLVVGNEDDAIGIMLHIRDRVALARQLLEGL